jgi:hypothetical protein
MLDLTLDSDYKKINNMKRILLLCIPAMLLTASCSDLDDYNIDPKSAVEVPGATLVTSAQRSLARVITSTNVNLNPFRYYVQHFAATTYADESQFDINTRAINRSFWDVLYRDVLRDLQEAETLITADITLSPEVKANQLAAIEVMQVYAWSVLVNTFGDIPYSEALDFTNVQPAYDDDAVVFNDLINRLNTAIGMFDVGAASLGEADLIYGGETAMWVEFANSLKLRMAMTIADVDEAKARTMVQEALPNVFTSNADNADLVFLTSPPNTNPLWEDLVQSGRQDFRGADTFVNVLNDLNDPRIDEYFKPIAGGNTFVGAVYGSVNAAAGFSAPGALLEDPTFAAVLLSYAEVEFLLAEAAARGFTVPGTAMEHYNMAVTASILEWGGTEAEAIAYLAQPSVNYLTAAGDWRQKIGTQKWIALYNQPVEGWKEWRRLDAPNLVAPESAQSDIPLRFPYPIVEQNLNTANYNAAASAIGGDVVTSKIFWDAR